MASISGSLDFVRGERGAAAAEYALILAIVGSGIAGAALFLGDAIAGAMDAAATCVQTAGVNCAGGGAPPVFDPMAP